MWWKKKKTCGYWDCKVKIPDDELLCADHKEKWNLGLIDRCPDCQRFKDIMYYKCMDCYVGRKVKMEQASLIALEPEHDIRVEYSDEWSDGYMLKTKSFIYIIGFDDAPRQVGQTPDIRRHLAELKKLVSANSIRWR